MTDDERTRAVRRAMEMVPVSRRELARRAGLAHTTLNRIAQGTGSATPMTARAVRRGLESVQGDVTEATELIEGATDSEAKEDEDG